MIAVIFEVKPKKDSKEVYFSKARQLREFLEQIDGFISVERFESLTNPDNLLSLSFWRDEQAVRSWKCQFQHRNAQQLGRDKLFDHYRIRVAKVIKDYDIDRDDEN
ncbi:antibiotic biosynthesis monooxygenase [Microbulbifer sp. THAF38]|uniref:antibiotic biosynthesis monooxygenase family protein n=1 Tax=Microbulbifer sp. THAF38 TaxID=2587856 RepID=UPI0012686C26|nr:antibiotic biosynthesis monooxygenase [Microbulbifer sp. THAF38]QFT56762.1 Antibiotic biosynthesis monooxygenase [Microbulbifer sp. THAF38]